MGPEEGLRLNVAVPDGVDVAGGWVAVGGAVLVLVGAGLVAVGGGVLVLVGAGVVGTEVAVGELPVTV